MYSITIACISDARTVHTHYVARFIQGARLRNGLLLCRVGR